MAILSFSLVTGRLGPARVQGEVEEGTVVASSEHMKVVDQNFAALGLDDKLEELDRC